MGVQGKGFSREDRGAREGVLKGGGGVYGGFSRGGVLFEILDNYELLLKVLGLPLPQTYYLLHTNMYRYAGVLDILKDTSTKLATLKMPFFYRIGRLICSKVSVERKIYPCMT